ncbi:sensor histidine kinase [Reyranella sp.]|uniref:sensor histidine kinase n=1 Tax=Reyranella sp. TaxID=1929291 RepID=UPI002721DB90|nr:sensor histidine kinase [Reyranella sp.]MDO8976273.1 sensor histidine kinase [Reyranella sp.]
MAFEQSRLSKVFTTNLGLRKEAPRSVASYEREIDERRGTETRLRETLASEEALMRQKDELIHNREVLSMEADHRLLNGLQMIVSLLSLQSRSEPNAEAAEHLSTAAKRVATLARVHRRLHALDGQVSVAFKPFLQELCGEYRSILASDERRKQTIVVEGADASLPARTAVPLSLIVNELITNAAKHGGGIITVRLEEPPEGGHLLSVCNEGPPLPEGFDPVASKGLGMKIVQALVEQIGGALRVGRCTHCGGPEFAVAFA